MRQTSRGGTLALSPLMAGEFTRHLKVRRLVVFHGHQYVNPLTIGLLWPVSVLRLNIFIVLFNLNCQVVDRGQLGVRVERARKNIVTDRLMVERVA